MPRTSLSDTLIDEGRWDVVVLQGQSQEAAKPEPAGNTRSSFLTGSHALCQRISAASPQARIVFYQTWARLADYWKTAKVDPSVGKDPAEMQARNRASYQRATAQPGKLPDPGGPELPSRLPPICVAGGM